LSRKTSKTMTANCLYTVPFVLSTVITQFFLTSFNLNWQSSQLAYIWKLQPQNYNHKIITTKLQPQNYNHKIITTKL